MSGAKELSPQAAGWNTWNSRSVFSHVLMPEGVAVNLGIKVFETGQTLTEALIGRGAAGAERIRPGIRTIDSSYTELTLEYGETVLTVKSAVKDGELCLLVAPQKTGRRPPVLAVQGALLWNRPGYVSQGKGNSLVAVTPGKTVSVYVTGTFTREDNMGFVSPYVCLELNRPAVISTGKEISLAEAEQLTAEAKERLLVQAASFGKWRDAYLAMTSCLCWDTIFEPEKNQICSPVSRIWSQGWGGYVLFCWDSFFSAMMAMPLSRELSFANLIAVVGEKTEEGFIPNFGAANGYKSRDRSQPPVGSLALYEVYRHFGDIRIVRALFDDLLEWNRWFSGHRMLENGGLCWGSNPYEPVSGQGWETEGVGGRFGAALESGMDNSPLYDEIPYDPETHMLCLADVGLTGLYIMDCELLAELAGELGREEEQKELISRAEHSKDGLEVLWCEEAGMYLNRRTDTGSFSFRMAPTNFYALFSDRVTPRQTERILEHFYDPAEFGGNYILPSIARNDPAYPEQDYWRGRIWPPLNFLVYLAMRSRGLKRECAVISEKSRSLLLQEWELYGHVHENYNGDSGMGCGNKNSDPFYHWGGLLALIGFYEAGEFDEPGAPLPQKPRGDSL